MRRKSKFRYLTVHLCMQAFHHSRYWGSQSAVGAGDVLGTLEAGKLADIVLLDANPLENIENTLAIWRVIVGGKVFVEPQSTVTGEEVGNFD
jgi:predicted amidohydrolase YtcJ